MDTTTDRFWAKVECGAPGECWPWTGALKDGYGRLSIGGRGGRILRAPRLAYEILVGPIPHGREVHHSCENKACVNPGHLELVTRREHMGRHPEGLMAQKAAQTHCLQGHPLEGVNVYLHRGRRLCRECKRGRDRARHMKSKHADYVAEHGIPT